MDALCQGDGYTTLDASGLSVGLPAGLMGNSEVGHLNIGAGRVVYQDIVRINMTSDNKEFGKNEFFAKACNTAKNGNGRLHFLGLVGAIFQDNFTCSSRFDFLDAYRKAKPYWCIVLCTFSCYCSRIFNPQ